MKKMVFLLVGMLSIGVLALTDAEARRMGGGASLGKQYSVPKQAAQPRGSAPAAASPSRPSAAAGTSGASRWLGPLAGLAAGGLLASLLFGDSFQGLQILDLLLVAALALGGLMLFRAVRRSASPQPAGAGAGFGGAHRGDGHWGGDRPASGPAALQHQGNEAPAWFNESRFLEGAKTHYIRLQAAWDEGDLTSLEEYTTPELLRELTAERERLGAERHVTEVMTLEAQLAATRRDGDQVVASILFSGLIREERDGRPQSIRELWHVAHAWDSPQGDWYLAGIQQLPD